MIEHGYMPQDQSLFDNSETREGRLFNQGETTKLNDHNIKMDGWETESKITGNVPTDLLLKSYNLLDSNGKVYEGIDYNGEAQKLYALAETVTDPAKKEQILEQATAYSMAGMLKVQQNPELYGKYLIDRVVGNVKNADTKQNNLNSADNRYLADLGLVRDTTVTGMQEQGLNYRTDSTNNANRLLAKSK